jgi:hypothetical protein
MSKISDLLHASLLRVFNERDNEARLAALGEIYADDVRFSDPEGVVTGRDAVNAKVRGLLDGAPGFVFTVAGPAYEVQDLGTLAWNFGPEGAAPLVSGTDVVTVVDGRIATLHTYLTSS